MKEHFKKHYFCIVFHARISTLNSCSFHSQNSDTSSDLTGPLSVKSMLHMSKIVF